MDDECNFDDIEVRLDAFKPLMKKIRDNKMDNEERLNEIKMIEKKINDIRDKLNSFTDQFLLQSEKHRRKQIRKKLKYIVGYMNKKKQVLKNSSILKEKPTNEQNDSLLEKQSYELTDQESLHISEQQSDQSQDVPIDEQIEEIDAQFTIIKDIKLKVIKATGAQNSSYIIQQLENVFSMINDLRKKIQAINYFCKSKLNWIQQDILRTISHDALYIKQYFVRKQQQLNTPKWLEIIRSERDLNNNQLDSNKNDLTNLVKMESSVEIVYLSSEDECQTTAADASHDQFNSTRQKDSSAEVSKMKIKKICDNYEISKTLKKTESWYNDGRNGNYPNKFSTPYLSNSSTLYRSNSKLSSLDSIDSIVKIVNDSMASTDKIFNNKLPISNRNNFEISSSFNDVSMPSEISKDNQSDISLHPLNDDISANQLGNKSLNPTFDNTSQGSNSFVSISSEQIDLTQNSSEKISEIKNDLIEELCVSRAVPPLDCTKAKSSIEISKAPGKKIRLTPKERIDPKLNHYPIVRIVQLPGKVIKKTSKKIYGQNGKISFKSVNINDIIASDSNCSDYAPTSLRKSSSSKSIKTNLRKKSSSKHENSFLYKRSKFINSDYSSDSMCETEVRSNRSAKNDSPYDSENSVIESDRKSSSKQKKKSNDLLKQIQTKHLDETKIPDKLKRAKEALSKDKKIKQNLKNNLFQHKLKSIQHSKTSVHKKKAIQSPEPHNSTVSSFKIPKRAQISARTETKKTAVKTPEPASSRINQVLKRNETKILKRNDTKTSSNIQRIAPNDIFSAHKKSDHTNAQSDILTVAKTSKKFINFPTINQITEQKKQFNQSIGCSHPYFNLSFLLQDYLTTIVKVPSLDINLLSKNIVSRVNDPLCVSNLVQAEKSELCRLMSRNAGKINFYQLFGIGYDLRENSQKKGFDLSGFEKYSESLRYGKPLQFENEKDEQQFVSEAISRLTMAEVFVVYSHFKQRLSSPYRNIRYFFDQNLDTYNIRVRFENNWPLRDKDPSPEECVKYILHIKRDDTSIKESIFRNKVYKKVEETLPVVDKKITGINFAKEKLRDEYDFDRLFMKKTYDRIGRMPEFSMRECFKNPDGIFRCDNIDIKNYLSRKTDVSFSKRKQEDDKPRFLNHYSALNNASNFDRGAMRKAESFESMTETEYKYKMKQLNKDSQFDFNISQILDSK